MLRIFPTSHTFSTSKAKNGILPSPYPGSSLAIHLYFGCFNSNSPRSHGYYILTPNQVQDYLLIVALDFKCPYNPLNSC